MSRHKLRELVQVLRSRGRWMPREKWDALVRGDACSICADLDQEENEYALRVAKLSVSNLMLARNQYAPGYCLLTLREHQTELHALPQDQREAFFDDLLQAGSAIAQVFGADKMNYQQLGNLVPHLHWHIVPRRYGDAAPGRPLNPDAGRRILTRDEYSGIISQLRDALNQSR